MRLFNSEMRKIICVVFLLSVFWNGCASLNKKEESAKKDEKEEEIVWPLPPDEPRIKYIKSISTELDVKVRREKTFLIKVFEFITGAIFGISGKEANMMRPYGIAEYDGILYVADQQLGVVHIFDSKAKEYYQIGKFISGYLVSPIDVKVDDKGNVYISDSVLKRVFVYDSNRINILTIGDLDIFERPTGLAINNEESRLYVVDTGANKIKVFDLQGNLMFTFGRRGELKGEELNFPTNIFLDKDGNVYICDSMNFKIKIFDKDGRFVSMFGKIGDKLGYFGRPKGVAVDSEGHIYVVDSQFDRVQIFNNKGALLLAFGKEGTDKGEFWLASGIYIDSKDRIYIADSYNKRVQVFQYLKSKESNEG